MHVHECVCYMHAGACDSSTYPLQKKRHTLEFLRSIAHLRARTNTVSAVARVRSALAQATHDFFLQQGFLYVHTPIISTSDCEGAGEMFQVRALTMSSNGAWLLGRPHACTWLHCPYRGCPRARYRRQGAMQGAGHARVSVGCCSGVYGPGGSGHRMCAEPQADG